MAKKYTKWDILDIQAAQKRADEWRRLVRRLAAMKHAWFRTATRLDISEEERGRRLQSLELAQRSLKASTWAAVPIATGLAGKGKDRYPVRADADRVSVTAALEHQATTLHRHCLNQLARRKMLRRGLDPDAPAPTPSPGAIHCGPYHVHAEDVPALLHMASDNMIRILELRKMAGQHASRSPADIAGKAGRPTPPKPVARTLQGALAVEMPFGRYRGEALEHLMNSRDGMSYIWWLCNEADIRSQRLQDALEVVYEAYEHEIEEARTAPNLG
jgi:hypothetical protein